MSTVIFKKNENFLNFLNFEAVSVLFFLCGPLVFKHFPPGIKLFDPIFRSFQFLLQFLTQDHL